MLKPIGYLANKFRRSYQQALDDYGITELLAKLSKCSNTESNRFLIQIEPQETENLATILISQLTQSITSQLIANYLNTIRTGNRDVLPGLIHPKYRPSTDLPTNFPDKAKTPRFLYGDRLRWRISNCNTDGGIVIGIFYSFAPHLCCWKWCYLIWLSKDSPSAAWTFTDIAWEEDLEALEQEQMT